MFVANHNSRRLGFKEPRRALRPMRRCKQLSPGKASLGDGPWPFGLQKQSELNQVSFWCNHADGAVLRSAAKYLTRLTRSGCSFEFCSYVFDALGGRLASQAAYEGSIPFARSRF